MSVHGVLTIARLELLQRVRGARWVVVLVAWVCVIAGVTGLSWLGLRKAGVMRLILLPQAVRAMLPVIVAQLVVTLKDTALGYIITYNELLYYARLIGTQAQYDRPILQAGMVAAAIYIALCLVLAGIAKWVEVRMRSSQRAGRGPQAGALGRATTDTEVIAAQRGAGKYDSSAL